jgi:preprotein translocase subunit SecG
MSFKILLRTLLFLAILFVMVVVGMENTKAIDFRFPMIWPKPVVQPAAYIYFAVFAVGVVAGTLLHFGGGKGKGSSKDGGKAK